MKRMGLKLRWPPHWNKVHKVSGGYISSHGKGRVRLPHWQTCGGRGGGARDPERAREETVLPCEIGPG